MSWKKFTQDYLTFSRKDRIGLLGLSLLILVMIFLPRFFAASKAEPIATADSAYLNALDTLVKREQSAKPDEPARQWNNHSYPARPNSFHPGALFLFDPNTLDEAGWQKLGLSARTSQTIVNYRQKGGKFYQPEDLQKIWGLPDGFYERVKDFIRIAESKSKQSAQQTEGNEEGQRWMKPAHKLAEFDLNEADTAAFIALPGIGSKLAARIVNFRNKLGGFYSVEQVAETYGLPDSTFQKLKPYFKVKEQEVKKISINTATKEELKAHPYIRWNLANAIVEYRNQHGPFGSVEDLKKINILDEDAWEKLKPYLTTDGN